MSLRMRDRGLDSTKGDISITLNILRKPQCLKTNLLRALTKLTLEKKEIRKKQSMKKKKKALKSKSKNYKNVSRKEMTQLNSMTKVLIKM